MTDQVKSKIAGAAKKSAPWRKGIAWWVVLLEGLVLLGLGLYMFFAPLRTLSLLAWILAGVLAITGALSVVAAMREKDDEPGKKWTMIHGIVGLVTGLIIVVLLLLNVLTENYGLFILGLGCLAYGGVALYMTMNDNITSLRRLSMIGTIFYMAFGGLLLFQAIGVSTLSTTLQVINFLILLLGIVLIIWAFIIRKEAHD